MANIIPRREEQRSGGGLVGGWRDPVDFMRDILRFDPFTEMGALSVGGGAFMPAFDVKETKDAYVFRADLPGFKEDDIDIQLTGNRITITGKREAEEKEEGERYYAYERTYGSFNRSFTLPEGIDKDHVRAELKDGVLTVAVAKKPEVQPKKISLTSSSAGTGQQAKDQQKARA